MMRCRLLALCILLACTVDTRGDAKTDLAMSIGATPNGQRSASLDQDPSSQSWWRVFRSDQGLMTPQEIERRRWFESLMRPDNHKHPYRDPHSRSCCGEGDTVKTQFRVELGNAAHPQDVWYAWLRGEWRRIPDDIVLDEHAPDGHAYLFMLGKDGHQTMVCFIRPRGGL